MTTTAPASRSTLAADGRGRLPAPTRDRRPALAALALLLVLGGALGSALIAYRSGDRVDVLVARDTIEAGSILTSNDLTVARVASDGAATIPAEAAANFQGSSVVSRIPAGTLLNRSMFLAGNVQPEGSVLVGVVLSATQRPSTPLRSRDVVRVFLVPRDTGTGQVATVLATAVRVADVPQLVGDDLRLSLLVPVENVTNVLTAAATGSLALTLLPPETPPAIDFRTEG